MVRLLETEQTGNSQLDEYINSERPLASHTYYPSINCMTSKHWVHTKRPGVLKPAPYIYLIQYEVKKKKRIEGLSAAALPHATRLTVSIRDALVRRDTNGK